MDFLLLLNTDLILEHYYLLYHICGSCFQHFRLIFTLILQLVQVVIITDYYVQIGCLQI